MQTRSIICLVAILFSSFCVFATDRVSTGSANWTTPGTWSPAGLPAAGDNITILSGHTITMNGNAGACANLTVNGTATWSTINLVTNVSGNLIINNGGSITGTATGILNVTGTFSVPSGSSATIGRVTISVSSTSTIDGTLTTNNVNGTKTFNNIVINSGGTWTSTAAETYTINGNLTMSGSTISGTAAGIYNVAGTFAVTAATNNTIGVGTIAVAGTTTVDGTINFTSLTGNKTFANVVMNSGSTWNSTVTETYTINNNLTMSGATATGTAAGIFNVAGNFITTAATTNTFGVGTMTVTGVTTNAGSIDFASTTGNKTFIGKITNSGTWTSSANEAFTIQGGITNNGTFTGGTGTYTFNTNAQIIDGANAISFGGPVTITGITVSNQNTNNVTITGILSGTGGFTQTANTTLFLGGNATITTLTAAANPNLVTYNGAAAQQLKGTTYYDLTITSGNTATAGAAFTCNNNLVLNSGTLASGNFTHTVSGTTTISGGTLSTSNVGGVYNLQSVSMTSGSIAGSATGAVNLATILNIPSGSATIGRCNLTVSGTTTIDGILDFNSAVGVKTFSDVTVDNGGTWSSTANSAFTSSGTITNNGTFTGGTGIYTLSGLGKFLSGSAGITLGGAAIAGTYTNSDAVSLTITGVLSGAGGLTQSANSNLFLGGNVTITTLTATANPNLVTYNGAGAQTMKGTTYYDLTITSGNTATAGAAFTCNNNLSVTAGTLASGNFTHVVSGTTTISGGTLSTSNAGGVYNLQSVIMTSGSIAGSATGNVNVATTLDVPSGAPTIGRCNLTVTGAATITGSLTFNNVTGAKTFGDVTVNGGGTWSSTVVLAFKINGNLSNSGTFTSNTGVYTLAGAGKTISGTLSINSVAVTGSYTNNASLTTATALTGAGTFSQGATGTLNIGATAANFTVTTFNASASGNTVNYNLAGAQSVKVPSDVSYHHLTLGGTGNKTLLGTTDINGNLTISSVLVANNFNMTVAGNWLNTGTFTPGTNTVTLDGAAQTITKAGGETFNHLTLSGSGIKTLGSAITTNGNLIITSTLDVSASNFGVTVKGNWTNNGTFTKQNGTVTFSGAAAQTIGGATTTDFYNLTQSNAAGVSLTHAQNLIGTLTISLGTFTATGFNFTLKSTVSGTASIAAIPAGANFAGNIIMQRYTGNGPTDWRFLSSAVSGATIADWADDFATSGFTGSTDPSNSFVSIYTYDETVTGVEANGFVAATNVTNSISNGKGFWVYLGPNPVTYSVTGPPNKFAQSPPVTFTASAGASDDGWNMVSNPYPSAIDWDNVNWTKTNMDNAVYIYNSSTGSFASYVGGIGVNGGSNYIASQQAFWVKANAAAPVLTMVENVKAAQNPSYLKTVSSPNTSHYPMAFKDFPIPMNVNTTTNSIKLTASGNGFEDETFIHFMQGASLNFDGSYDAWKMQNLNPSVPSISSVINDSTDLSINSLPDLNSNTDVKIRFTVPIAGTYSIRRDSMLMMPMSSCIFLEDLANGNMIDLRSTISYSFTISDTTKAPRFLLHIYAPISKQTMDARCSNDSTGIAIAKGTGSGPWNYIWTNSNGDTLKTSSAVSTSDSLFNLPAGIYTVQVSGSVCGTVSDTIQIKSSSTFSLASGFSNVSCYGMNDGTAAAIVTGGIPSYTYLWNSGATTSAINNLATGNYSVAVTDAAGCAQTETFSISQPALLHSAFTAADTVDLSVSNSEAFTNNSLGAAYYLWNFGDTTSADTSQNPVHNYNYAGTYTVTLISSNGNCSDSSYKTIVVVDSLNSNPTSVPSQDQNLSSVNVIYDKGEVYLAFDLPDAEDVTINVYNLMGEKIFSREVYHIQKNKIKLDAGNISSGIYIAVAQMPDVVISKKILFNGR